MEQIIFITKWALSEGILKATAKIERDNVATVKRGGIDNYFRKGEYFLTEKEAIADFEQRKAKKLESLKKQIAKMEKRTAKIKDL